MPDFAAQYDALTTAAGLVDLDHRTQIEISGIDRTAWLNNLCTNDVKRLKPGTGCEAFLTTVQGKTLAHVFVFCLEKSLVIDTVPSAADVIIPHLDRYIISEDVQLRDRTSEWHELLVAGPRADAVLAALGEAQLPSELLAHAQAELAGTSVALRRVDWAGPGGVLFCCPTAEAGAVREAIDQAGAVACKWETFEAIRIEAATPFFGQDITKDNLPQEIDRNERSINFTKGCYLGQETVARIDALGHVNKLLRPVRFTGNEIPPPDTELRVGETVVGKVTSAAWSPKHDSPLALAYIRRGHETPGTSLESDLSKAVVV